MGRQIDWEVLNNPDFWWKILFNPKSSKKRKRGEENAPYEQTSPFDASLSHHYEFEKNHMWSSMTKYRKFTLQTETFEVGDKVLINYAEQTEETAANPIAEVLGGDFNVGEILEIRAYDDQHVYVRVYYYYRPEELRDGRQPYHATNELIASNHMQVVDAMSINGRAPVKHWDEFDDDAEPLPEFAFWRQTYNVLSRPPFQLSEPRKHCTCNQYYNPNKFLINCTNKSCEKWLHGECLEKDAVQRAYSAKGVKPPKETNGDLSNGTDTPSKKSKRGRPSKGGDDKDVATNSQEQRFTAKVHDEEKPFIEVTDRSPGEGEKGTWEESISCLACSAQIE